MACKVGVTAFDNFIYIFGAADRIYTLFLSQSFRHMKGEIILSFTYFVIFAYIMILDDGIVIKGAGEHRFGATNFRK